MLKPLDPSILEEDQRRLREQFTAGPSLRALNQENILKLAQAREYEYPKGSGNVYIVPQVPFPDGIALNDLFYRIMESKKYESPVQLPILERQLRDIIKIIWKLSIPKDRIKRVRKKFGLLKNPLFNFASEGEIADLIAFFLLRRMMSNVYIRYPANRPNRNR